MATVFSSKIKPSASRAVASDRPNYQDLINEGKKYLWAFDQRRNYANECVNEKNMLKRQPLPSKPLPRFFEVLHRAKTVQKINKNIKRFLRDCDILMEEYNLLPPDIRRAIEDERCWREVPP